MNQTTPPTATRANRYATVEAYERAEAAQKAGSKSKNAALRRLRDAHEAEYQRYYREEMAQRGFGHDRRTGSRSSQPD